MSVSVIGLGKLGAPLVAVLASKGVHVTGVDQNRAYVDAIDKAKPTVVETGLRAMLEANQERISATVSYEDAILASRITFVIVPTPSDESGEFSNKYVLNAVQSIGKALQKKQDYHLVVIVSTVMPGSMGGDIKSALESASLRKVGIDVGLCYNPEFIALGNVIADLLNPDFLLIGESDRKAGDILATFYKDICNNNPPIRRMNFVNAEIVKISVNTFVTTKISYANMLSDLCDRLPGADVNVVTSAVGEDSRIGQKYLRGGVAFGGPCFPRDNVAFVSLANRLEVLSELAQASLSINQYQSQRLCRILENYPNAKIGLLGLSYKPNTVVAEESQGVYLANALVKNGCSVYAYDPMAVESAKSLLNEQVQTTTSLSECMKKSDIVVLVTPWPEFIEGLIANSLEQRASRLIIIDCWHLLPKGEFHKDIKIYYLGNGNDYCELTAKQQQDVAASIT